MTKEQLKTMQTLHTELKQLYRRHEKLSRPLKPGRFNTPWRREQFAAWRKDVEDKIEQKSTELGELAEELYQSFGDKGSDVFNILWLRYTYDMEWEEIGKRFGKSGSCMRKKAYPYVKDCP